MTDTDEVNIMSERQTVATFKRDATNTVLNFYEDEDLINPRTDDDFIMGKMFCAHGRYNLGDEQIDSSKFNGWNEVEKSLKKEYDIVIPLYLYDHGGITISTTPFSCPWDSGQVGFIVLSKKRIRDMYAIKRVTKKWLDRAMAELDAEVKTYDSYLCGDGYYCETIANGQLVDSISKIGDLDAFYKEQTDMYKD